MENNNEFRWEFRGADVSREVFIEKFVDALLGFVGFDNGFAMFMIEIVKNIYDHAEGRGMVTLTKKGHILKFEVKDFGTKSYDLEEIRKKGSTKARIGNKVNFGAGICGYAIDDLAQGIGVTFTVDTTHGFCYTGTYPM